MDSLDLFKKLTTNLSFHQNGNGSNHLKRKLPESVDPEDDEHVKPKVAKSVEPPPTKNANSKTGNQPAKKINLVKVHEENINHIRNVHHINVNGDDVPYPIEKFEDLVNEAEFKKLTKMEYPKKLIENLKPYKFEELTAIQMQAIPVMLNDREIMACAPTGSGKTLAFLFPTLCHLISLKTPAERNGIKALILAPTRELAYQIYIECNRLATGLDINAHIISKTSKELKIAKNFDKSCNILITTPNRLIFLLNDENVKKNLRSVEWLIVDEADKLFEEGQQGFRDQLGVIYKACDNPKVRHAFFSATYTNEVEEWCKLNLNNMIQVSIGRKNKASYSIQQELLYVGNDEGKLIAIRNLFKEGFEPPILVFVDSKDRANALFKELIYDNIYVDIISSDRTQQQRDNTMRSFRQGKIWVLICTELLSRGIDFKGVNLVVNYDFPTSGISYVHRIGRSGRAGRLGRAVTFFTDNDIPDLKRIVNIIQESGCKVPDFMLDLKKPKRAKKNAKGKKTKKNKAKTAKSCLKTPGIKTAKSAKGTKATKNAEPNTKKNVAVKKEKTVDLKKAQKEKKSTNVKREKTNSKKDKLAKNRKKF